MYHRDTRPFAYDEQSMGYPSGHVPQNGGAAYPPAGYQTDGSGHYYVAPAHEIGGANDGTCSLCGFSLDIGR